MAKTPMGAYKSALEASKKKSSGASNTFATSSAQSDALSRYAGTQYEQMVSSNPNENRSYTDSFWDKVGDFFGFRTRQDKRREDLELRSADYLAQIDSLAREERYNSESAKVERMRAAGLNPDLTGIDSASTASEFNEPDALPEAPEGGEGAGKLTGFLGGLIQSGSSIVGALTQIGSFFLSLHGAELEFEGKRYDNAGKLIGLLGDATDTFDMPDLDAGEISEGEEGVEGIALSAAKVVSDRRQQLADALFGKRNSPAKVNFIAGAKAHNGTLSKLTSHLEQEAAAAIAGGDVNVARASLKGRRSRSNAEILEQYTLEACLNDLEYKATISGIEADMISEQSNQDNYEKSLENELQVAAETDAHLQAVAANAGAVADTASASADVVEASARKAEALAKYDAKNLELMEGYYNSLMEKYHGRPPRRMMRQIRQHFGYGPVNEPSTGLNAGGNVSGSASYRGSRSLVKKILPK